ncbi:hypothetical protein N431DRAFT_506075, partial [Stipitochalara longipes BDJ]
SHRRVAHVKLHHNTVDSRLAKYKKDPATLQAIQRLCPRAPHDEDQLYGDRYGVTVQTRLGPGRFDRSSAISQKPKGASQFDRSQMARVQKGLVSIVRVCVFSPSSRSPLSAPLIPLSPSSCSCRCYCCCYCCCKRKKSAGLHVHLHHARSEEGQPYRHWRKERPRLHPQAMPRSRRRV